jgi:UDP-2,3-diacylglucosamine pyrophosphatase LpxH
MDAIIISDLHIGAGNCQAKLLVKFLEEISNTPVKKLILNGDVFENFDLRLQKWHWKVLSEIRKISDTIEVIWVKGNHDAYGPASSIAHLIGAEYVGEYSFISGDRSILCIHGDTFDTFISDHPIITYFSDIGYWFLQKLDKILNWGLAKWAKHNSKTFLRCVEKVMNGALRYKGEHDMVCCGHTHFASAGRNYCNSGTWTEIPSNYLIVENGSVELRSYIGREAQWTSESIGSLKGL